MASCENLRASKRSVWVAKQETCKQQVSNKRLGGKVVVRLGEGLGGKVVVLHPTGDGR